VLVERLLAHYTKAARARRSGPLSEAQPATVPPASGSREAADSPATRPQQPASEAKPLPPHSEPLTAQDLRVSEQARRATEREREQLPQNPVSSFLPD